jgi:NTE family protein
MRASMAIPTVFEPQIIDSVPYLDGGMVNNFPVQEVKEMGADIIIGVDVGFRPKKNKELNSIVKIVEQSVFMHNLDLLRRNRDSCRIYIQPDLKNYNMSSFGKVDSLIVIGERSARKAYPQLLELSKYLHSFGDTISIRNKPLKGDSIFYIADFVVNGLNDVPQEFLRRKLPFEIPAKVDIEVIRDFIESIYGTSFFESVSYSFETSTDGVRLVLNVREKNMNLFRVGLHYDSDFKTTLLLNTTFRNILFRGAKISFNLGLGDNPFMSAQIHRNTGWNPRSRFLLYYKLVPDFGVNIRAGNTEVYEYNGNQRIASYNFSDVVADAYMQANPRRNVVFNLGALFDASVLSPKITFQHESNITSYLAGAYFTYRHDSYDFPFFPTMGNKSKIDLRVLHNLNFETTNRSLFAVANANSSTALSITDALSCVVGFSAGANLGDSIPVHYRFYMGGQNNSAIRGLMPFAGLKFMQIPGNYVASSRLDLQWEVWSDNFITLRGNVGKITETLHEFKYFRDIVVGYGAAFGYRSPIGPMEITVMQSNKNPTPMFFINVGFGL